MGLSQSIRLMLEGNCLQINLKFHTVLKPSDSCLQRFPHSESLHEIRVYEISEMHSETQEIHAVDSDLEQIGQNT